MTIPRAIFNQVRAMLRPLETKISNIAARAIIKIVSDAGTRQTAQVDGLPTETLDGVQHFIPYGLISVPRAGAEGVMLFVDGDRGHPLLFAVDDRSARPTGGDPGDTGLYHFDGARVRLQENGDIVISAKAGGKVLIDDGSGGTSAFVPLKEHNNFKDWVEAQFAVGVPGVPGTPHGHVHVVGGAATTTITTVAAPAATPPAPSIPPTAIGSTVLEGK